MRHHHRQHRIDPIRIGYADDGDVLSRRVQPHAARFIAHTEARTGGERPRFANDESDGFFESGILAQGFLGLRCGECGRGRLPAFSCKWWGCCPSCGARRMARSAANQVDQVVPHAAVPI